MAATFTVADTLEVKGDTHGDVHNKASLCWVQVLHFWRGSAFLMASLSFIWPNFLTHFYPNLVALMTSSRHRWHHHLSEDIGATKYVLKTVKI